MDARMVRERAGAAIRERGRDACAIASGESRADKRVRGGRGRGRTRGGGVESCNVTSFRTEYATRDDARRAEPVGLEWAVANPRVGATIYFSKEGARRASVAFMIQWQHLLRHSFARALLVASSDDSPRVSRTDGR